MRNKIYNYFFKEFFSFFAIILFALTAIVWTVQAVNYLELVTEDGHAFNVYFMYSVLGIPKIITKLVPFTFLTALLLTILKFEKSNELIVLWTSGINKIRIVNVFFLISILVTLLQLIFASTLSPASLNFSRSLVKNSDIKFFSSMLKERKFNDTVKNLTVFVEKKNIDGTVNNIFLRNDTNEDESSTTFAKKGYLKEKEDANFLVMLDGVTQKEKKDGQISFIHFKKSQINLSEYSTKTTSWPKIQENTTFKLFSCLFTLNKVKDDPIVNYLEKNINIKSFFENEELINSCSYKKFDIINEINRRFGMPIYIPVLSLIICYLLSSRKESKNSEARKYLYFLIGFVILVFAEISVRYSGKLFIISMAYYLIPLLLIIFNYLNLTRVFKFENLKS